MTEFEFFMVMVSIIVALGIERILTGVAQSHRCRKSIQLYWVHSIAVLVVSALMFRSWWQVWEAHLLQEWNFLVFVHLLMSPVAYFIMAHLLFPDPVQGANFREAGYLLDSGDPNI